MPRLLAAPVVLACLVAATAGCRSAGTTRPVGDGKTVGAEGSVGPASRAAYGSGSGSASAIAASPSAWVAALRSEDFETRNRAAERLIALGEGSLDALSAAGDGAAVVHGRLTVSTTRPVVDEILAKVPDERLVRVHLVASAAIVRRSAAEELGRRDAWGSVPFLIDRLDDGDAGVRGAASASLRRITNQFFAYEPRAGARDREVAASTWRAWWWREGRLAAADATHKRG